MTVHELSQLYYLREEIKKDEKKLRALKLRRGYASPNYDDMPHGSGPKGSKDEDLTAEIVDLEEIIKAKLIVIQRERNRLERFIVNIPDSRTRQIFSDRFVECMSWAEVAYDIGKGASADSVKKTCYRYLKREPQGLTARQAQEGEKLAREYESTDTTE